MIPVDQTRFQINIPLTEPPGNCWQACIASILELDLASVPDEADYWKPGMSHRQSWRLYHPAMKRWLFDRGFILLEVKPPADVVDELFDPICIMSGPSPRNPAFYRAVVAKGMTMIHDPHPVRRGVIVTDWNEVTFEYFLPRNPKQWDGQAVHDTRSK